MPKAPPKRAVPRAPLSRQLAEDERAKHTRKTQQTPHGNSCQCKECKADDEWTKSHAVPKTREADWLIPPKDSADVLAAIESDEREGIDNATPELIERIWATGRLLWKKLKDIAKLEDDLKEAQEEARRLSETVLPELMSEAQTKELTSDTGVKLEKSDKVYASISKANEADAMKWLEAKGFGAIIKSAFSIPVDKGDTKTAKLIRQLMKKNKLAYEEKSGVHFQTLQAFVRESIEKARTLPPSIAYTVKPVVEIKLPKAKKTSDKFVSDSNDINL